MVKEEDKHSEIIEQVDIFLFFYRPKADTEKVIGIEYVQRLLYGYCT